MKRYLTPVVVLALVGLGFTPARAQSGNERPAVAKAVQFLKSQVSGMTVGEAGIAALALYKAEVPVDDPGITACLAKVGQTFANGAYTPELRGGPDTYEATVVILALVNIDAIGYKPQIELAVNHVISHQGKNGAWDYSNRFQGDTSMSQYAILGLWAAENAGVPVPPEVWDNAAKWFISVQGGAGSWNYHRDEGMADNISMSAAGVGSLMICQRQLARHRKGQDLLNPLMIPIKIDGQSMESRYKVETSAASITQAIDKGLDWISRGFVINSDEGAGGMGQSACYGLYGIERIAALKLKDREFLGGIDWYGKGLSFLLSKQESDGSWNIKHGKVANTCWALLFLVKSTAKELKAIEVRKLGGGMLRGGKGLPSDLTNVEVVGGQLVAKPMGGAIEGMLAILEDANSTAVDSALAGLVAKYQTDGPKALRPLKDRFRKMLRDPDSGKRQIAVWGLGRMGDLDSAPLLIRALLDEDDAVVNEARTGLQVLSRNLDGFGPPPKASREVREAAARKWQAWFNSVKTPDLDAPDVLLPGGPKSPTTKPPAQ